MRFGARRPRLSTGRARAARQFDIFAALPVCWDETMRVSEFDYLEYDALLKGSKQRSWLWLGLIVSLGLHLALCAYFYRARFQSVDAIIAANQQTSTFKVKNVDLGQQLDKSSLDQTNAAAKPEPDNTNEQQPDEKKAFDKLLQEIQAS